MTTILLWLSFLFAPQHATLRESPFRVMHLHAAARNLPDVATPGMADDVVDFAVMRQTRRVPAALIVALAWGESRFDPMASPACGVMQVYPNDLGEPASACALWRRDLQAGVRAGVREIEMMLDDKRVHNDLYLALLYRACGNQAFNGTCAKHAWVRDALYRWHTLEINSASS